MGLKPCDVRGRQFVGSKRGVLTEAGKRGSRRKGDQAGDQSNRRRRLTHERPERCRLVESGMHWDLRTGVAVEKVDLWLGWCVFTWETTCFGIARQPDQEPEVNPRSEERR